MFISRYIYRLFLLTSAFIVLSSAAYAVEVEFKPVSDGVYAYIGDTDGRNYENEGLNANIGLIVTPAGAVLIDSGSSFQTAQKIHKAVQKITQQPIKWVINTGDQDHRWLGNGYFKAQGIEIIAHANAEADMKARKFEQMEGLKVLKERLDGTVPTLPTRFLKDNDTKLELGGVVIELKYRNGGHTPGDIKRAIKSFDAKPYAHLKHAGVWIPQLANATYLEVERE